MLHSGIDLHKRGVVIATVEPLCGGSGACSYLVNDWGVRRRGR